VIEALREQFNGRFEAGRYEELLRRLDARCGARVGFRVAETPVFLPLGMLERMAEAGREMTERLLAWPEYLAAAERAIPPGYRVAGASAHPNFMTADFALARGAGGELEPKLVEMQAFPSVYAYQAILAEEYRRAFELPGSLGAYLGGLNDSSFWALLRQTVLGGHAPEHVVLTEVEPERQKTLPDFLLTAERLGIAVVDIAEIEPVGRKLHYRNAAGNLVPIYRIYNRAIADEMMARRLRLRFDLEADWDVEWAGHPNWYFRVSKFAIPWLAGTAGTNASAGHAAGHKTVPTAAFLEDFLTGSGYGPGYDALAAAGVRLPDRSATKTKAGAVYEDLLLKPLFSFAGKGIVFAPSHEELLSIPVEERHNYLVQQRMSFEPTIATPRGLTQAEIRILYLWPDGDTQDGGRMTPAISLVRLGRGRMMGVDHNRNQEWVGGSAAFWSR